MLPVLFATYGAVFVAEIVGDKLLYTTGVLATRYRTAPILFGMAIAFMAKMAVAVLVGKAISTAAAAAGGGDHHGQLLRHRFRPVAQAGPQGIEEGVPRVAGRDGLLRGHLLLGMGRHRADHRGHHGGAIRFAVAGLDWRGRRHGDQRRAGSFDRRRRPAVDSGSLLRRRRCATRRWACCFCSACFRWSKP